jgi:hypothetical protein
MATMAKVFIHATCCEVSKQWGVAHVTSYHGRLPENVKCSACGKEYRVEYEEHEPMRVANYEDRLKVAAQRAIDASHPVHGNYVEVGEF